MTDTVINQPKSALKVLAGKAESSLDMTALIKAIHIQDGVILEKDNALLEKDNALLEKDNALLEKDNALLEKDNALLEKDNIIQKKSVVIDEQKKRIALLEEYLRLERARLYGRSSEKNQRPR